MSYQSCEPLSPLGGGILEYKRLRGTKTASISAGGDTYVTFDFSNDMDPDDHIIAMCVAGTGNSKYLPRWWHISDRTKVQADISNLSSSTGTATIEVQVLVTKAQKIPNITP